MTDQTQLEACVTRICECGCMRVREVIAILQANRSSIETHGATPAQRAQILQQLQDIMQVYDAKH